MACDAGPIPTENQFPWQTGGMSVFQPQPSAHGWIHHVHSRDLPAPALYSVLKTDMSASVRHRLTSLRCVRCPPPVELGAAAAYPSDPAVSRKSIGPALAVPGTALEWHQAPAP